MDQTTNALPRMESLLKCPDCKSSLQFDTQRCSGCGRSFQYHDRFCDFLAQGSLSLQNIQEIELHKKLSHEYGRRYAQDFAKHYSSYWNKQLLAHLPKQAEAVLDCGCGTGELLQDLVPRGGLVFGMDISKAMLLQGMHTVKPAENLIWIATPGESMPFADNVLDAVCFRGALHHMSQEQLALEETFRILKPGGHILLSEPNDDSLVLRLPRKIVNTRMKRFGNDHKAFRSAELIKRLTRIGFTVTSKRYFSYLSEPLCGMSDLFPLLNYLPFSGSMAQFIIAFDETCSKLPGIQKQSFELILSAQK
ncbi:MAG: methyltransferase domain-containing protein [Desulfohalobiaceae bacterium]|nr:methyltransferase domain-containing protein [Desulfohalobiaceae bacterium]